MAKRNLLHKKNLEEFKAWLVDHGRTLLPTKGDYEVLRWKHGKGDMPIIFNGKSPVHYSCNDVAIPSIRKFIEYKKRLNETKGNK